ncbi:MULTISPECIES: MFS transporter [Streptomyces]|uniref:MFS transporter n=1 Tax=Streptomyces bugieae TaxID=3098223 RepID=A0ABU7NIY8_9ACTN|nr:MFS transporter [Streptomyces nigrescens]MEE4418305.1 MFS transporter [Streptomyces sp. DSM 41528]
MVARRLLPLLFVLYVVNFLDRANIGVAALTMNADLGLSATAYGTAAGIFFLGYVLFQVPAAVALKRFGARRWLCCVITAWGVCSAATAFVTDAQGLYLTRFVLGLTEAGFFPGVVAYLAAWFPCRQRTRALALFLLAIPVSNMVGLPVSGLLVDHFSLFGLSGWRSMFLIEGAPAVVLGVAALRLLTDTPRDATWLTAPQREELEALLTQGAPPSSTDRTTLGHAAHFTVVNAGPSFAAYALQFFLPKVTASLFPGAGASAASALAALPSVFTAVAMLAWSRHGDRVSLRTYLIAAPIAAAAAAISLAALSPAPVLTLAALTVAGTGILTAVPAFWSRCTAILSGPRAATALAGVNAASSLASFAGPYVTGLLTDTTGGYRAAYSVIACALAVSLAAALRLPGAPVGIHRALAPTRTRG